MHHSCYGIAQWFPICINSRCSIFEQKINDMRHKTYSEIAALSFTIKNSRPIINLRSPVLKELFFAKNCDYPIAKLDFVTVCATLLHTTYLISCRTPFHLHRLSLSRFSEISNLDGDSCLWNGGPRART